MELLQNLYVWLCWYFRPAIKWFLRQTTRLCELQRICYGEAPGALRTMGVGKFEIMTVIFKVKLIWEPGLNQEFTGFPANS